MFTYAPQIKNTDTKTRPLTHTDTHGCGYLWLHTVLNVLGKQADER